MQALLYETKRLKEENEVLHLQVSSLGHPRSRQPRSHRTNSKQNEEASYLGNAKFLSDEQEMQSEERS
ncbi:hypothetical protein CK203_097898 [Vitis vinifera]|uniref:Uncharacterized protein n=1 Tax=Vitis vinifera TaxID=29760 RepID=A0A438D4I2_VITVI|nr:hypothetical protein CK203_097898 [Vitis vinifera]